MAQIPPPQSNAPAFDTDGEPAPAGTFVAKCIDIKDQFGVQRPKFENPQEIETLDVTTFLFGFRDAAGQPHKIATREMRISSNEKSALIKMLTSWLGTPPAVGWDYCEMKGRPALLTIAHKPMTKFPGKFFANIVGVTALPAGMDAQAARAQQPRMPQPPTPPPPPAPAPEPVEPDDNDDPLPF